MSDWKIFRGDSEPHDGLLSLPPPPPWRHVGIAAIGPADDAQLDLGVEATRAQAFRATEPMVLAVNTALYLRRPLLLTGKPGTGKSTLISKVAHELRLGPVLRWPINSRSTLRSGVYEYDAVGRLQASKGIDPPVQDYLTLGPLGSALVARSRPRALLIDEIDKSDLDFANDLLNLIEEGDYVIPELQRLATPSVLVRDYAGQLVQISNGHLRCTHFPFVIMTSNGEREFPAPFLRRCIRLTIEPPTPEELVNIVDAHLEKFLSTAAREEITKLVNQFVEDRTKQEMSTDQLLNAVFLTIAMKDSAKRTFSDDELKQVRDTLRRPLAGPNS